MTAPLLAAALILRLILPLWGANVPQWARDLGHIAAITTHEEWCGRYWRYRMKCPPQPDSAQVVASCDSLAHWEMDPPVVMSFDFDSLCAADSARLVRRK